MSQLSSYGVNITPPSPISYAMPTNGSIASIISGAQTAQNAANAANQLRYGQMLGVLNSGATGQNNYMNQAQSQLASGYQSAQGSLGNSLANDQTVFNNENQQIGLQAQQAAGSAQQSAVERGLGNTTIQNAMQTQVGTAAQQAYNNSAAAKAQADNSVYTNIANLYSAQGNAQAGLSSQQGGTYAQGANNIANAIGGATDQAPSLSQYASLIQAAAAANRSQNPSTITTTNPNAIPGFGTPLYGPGASGGVSGGGAGVQASQGNYNGGIGSATNMGAGGYSNSNGASYFGQGYGGGTSNGSGTLTGNTTDTSNIGGTTEQDLSDYTQQGPISQAAAPAAPQAPAQPNQAGTPGENGAAGNGWQILGTTPDQYGNVTAINKATGQRTTGPLSYFQQAQNYVG